jgi:hypothetical protein
MRVHEKGNNNTKLLAYTALVRPIFEYGAVCLGTYREGLVGASNRLQKREAIFANNINESSWETLAQRTLIAHICAPFKEYNGGRAWKAIEDRLLKPCYLSREDHNRKIRSRKQRQVLVNRTFKAGTDYLQA